MNREDLSQIAYFITEARQDTMQAAKQSDRLHLSTAHFRLLLACDALDDAMTSIREADTAAALLEQIGK